MSKSKKADLYYINEWSLTCQALKPTDDAILSIAHYINTHGDAAKLPNVEQLAAFILVVGEPKSGELIFKYSDLSLLSRRPFAIIQNVLHNIGDGVADKVSKQLLLSEVSNNDKRSTKTTSKQRSRSKTVSG